MDIDMRLSREDLQNILDIVQGYVDTYGHTLREGEYPIILKEMIDSMCWDDHISVIGGIVDCIHG